MSAPLPKLVRDKIPEIIRDSGKDMTGHVAYTEEYNRRVIEKMREELDEFAAAPSLEEAADMYEVLLAILENWNLELLEVILFAQNKAIERGKFKLGIILDEVLSD